MLRDLGAALGTTYLISQVIIEEFIRPLRYFSDSEQLTAHNSIAVAQSAGVVPTTLPDGWVSEGCYVYARTTLPQVAA